MKICKLKTKKSDTQTELKTYKTKKKETFKDILNEFNRTMSFSKIH